MIASVLVAFTPGMHLCCLLIMEEWVRIGSKVIICMCVHLLECSLFWMLADTRLELLYVKQHQLLQFTCIPPL